MNFAALVLFFQIFAAQVILASYVTSKPKNLVRPNLKLLLAGKDERGRERDVYSVKCKEMEALLAPIRRPSMLGLGVTLMFNMTLPAVQHVLLTCLEDFSTRANAFVNAFGIVMIVFLIEALLSIVVEKKFHYNIRMLPKLMIIAYLKLAPGLNVSNYLLEVFSFCFAMAFFSMLLIFKQIDLD